ncbi:Uma2 family endonuclease, partial [Nonomuraea sp. RK-328]|nr:Uma2 family endonuclease [Nonomuraea sp. RK-328]
MAATTGLVTLAARNRPSPPTIGAPEPRRAVPDVHVVVRPSRSRTDRTAPVVPSWVVNVSSRSWTFPRGAAAARAGEEALSRTTAAVAAARYLPT